MSADLLNATSIALASQQTLPSQVDSNHNSSSCSSTIAINNNGDIAMLIDGGKLWISHLKFKNLKKPGAYQYYIN